VVHRIQFEKRTLYGGDSSPRRDAALLDAAKDAAREDAARAEGFRRIELMATMAGEPLYRACGYVPVERTTDARGGAEVPLLKMERALSEGRTA
jgi:hypothetical protein